MQTPMGVVRLLAKAAGRVMRSQSIQVMAPKGKDALKDALEPTKATNIHPPWQIGQKKKNRKSKSESPPAKPTTD